MKMNYEVWIEPFKEILSTRSSFSFGIMRFFGRLYFIRNLFRKETSPSRNTDASNDIDDTLIQNHVTNIRKMGFSTGLCLDRSQLDSIIEHCNSSVFYNSTACDKSYKIDFSNPVNPGDGWVYRLTDPHKNNETINDIAHSTLINSVAKSYLGASSQLMGTQLWYTFPCELGESDPHFGFHYDLDDYGFLKAFFYINDVTTDNGPHEIISESHQGDQLFKFFNRRLTADQVEKRYSDRVVTMEGSAGQGFFEDTFSYHRGAPARKVRLLFQIEYAVSGKEWNN